MILKILRNYESSTSTLRGILSDPSLHRTNIDKTIDALAEANYAAQEVDSAIRIGGDVALGVDVDEEGLEDEWRTLVQDIGADAITVQTLDLPSAPTTSVRVGPGEPERQQLPSL